MSPVSYGCIECHSKLVSTEKYTSKKKATRLYFQETSQVERERVCPSCGLVHNIEGEFLKKITFGNLLKQLSKDQSFISISEKKRYDLLLEIRKFWNENYKNIDREQNKDKLLDYIINRISK